MSKINEKIDIISPQNRLKLFGYKNYFNSFVELYKKNKLPNTLLLSGPKGIGKTTFAYHFINYLLSQSEENKYSTDDFTINSNNKSYNGICNLTNPNFFLIKKNDLDTNIKIDDVRSALKFINKSTFGESIKIVLIEDAEYPNNYSANAMLKSLEETNGKVFFIIINNNNARILDTIKSRCIEFKLFFSFKDRKEILKRIVIEDQYDFHVDEIFDLFHFDTPGNILRYLLILGSNELDLLKDKFSCILYTLDIYKKKNEPELLSFISLLIELFYNELAVKNEKNVSYYFMNKFKLLKQIYLTKKFNLDKKNLFIFLQTELQNDSK